MVGLLAVEFAVPAYVYVPWAALLVASLGLAVFAGSREQRIRLGSAPRSAASSWSSSSPISTGRPPGRTSSRAATRCRSSPWSRCTPARWCSRSATESPTRSPLASSSPRRRSRPACSCSPGGSARGESPSPRTGPSSSPSGAGMGAPGRGGRRGSSPRRAGGARPTCSAGVLAGPPGGHIIDRCAPVPARPPRAAPAVRWDRSWSGNRPPRTARRSTAGARALRRREPTGEQVGHGRRPGTEVRRPGRGRHPCLATGPIRHERGEIHGRHDPPGAGSIREHVQGLILARLEDVRLLVQVHRPARRAHPINGAGQHQQHNRREHGADRDRPGHRPARRVAGHVRRQPRTAKIASGIDTPLNAWKRTGCPGTDKRERERGPEPGSAPRGRRGAGPHRRAVPAARGARGRAPAASSW